MSQDADNARAEAMRRAWYGSHGRPTPPLTSSQETHLWEAWIVAAIDAANGCDGAECYDSWRDSAGVDGNGQQLPFWSELDPADRDAWQAAAERAFTWDPDAPPSTR